MLGNTVIEDKTMTRDSTPLICDYVCRLPVGRSGLRRSKRAGLWVLQSDVANIVIPQRRVISNGTAARTIRE